jgi:meiosis-specific protein HOP1
VQIFVHADPQRRDEILESYTFTIQYDAQGPDRTGPIGLQVSNTTEAVAMVQSSNKALQFLLRQVNKLCDGLSQLPKDRLLSMELVYDEGAIDQSRRVPGFKPVSNGDICFPTVDGWEQARMSQALGSGFHNAMLTISHLESTSGILELPSDLEFAVPTSRYAALDMSASPNNGTSRITSLASANNNKLLVQKQPRNASKLFNANGSADLAQSSQVPEISNALQDMLQPEQIAEGDTQSQNPVHRPPPASITATPTTRHATPSGTVVIDTPSRGSGFALLPAVQRHIIKQAKELKDSTNSIATELGKVTKSGQRILCQCGHQEEEGDMVCS